MSDIDLDISSLMGASRLDAVIAKLEELKRQLADSEMEAQRLAAKRLKHNAHLRELSEKTESAKEALGWRVS